MRQFLRNAISWGKVVLPGAVGAEDMADVDYIRDGRQQQTVSPVIGVSGSETICRGVSPVAYMGDSSHFAPDLQPIGLAQAHVSVCAGGQE